MASDLGATAPSVPDADDPVRAVTTSIRLSDGRELIYFDDPATPQPRPEADLHDRRELPAVSLSTASRFDRLTREWVTTAQHRQTRTYLPPDDQCPLCPSTGTRLSEIPAEHFDVAVFENRFPSFTGRPPQPGTDEFTGDGGPLLRSAPGYGRCEVVVFTDDHDAAFSSLTPTRARTVIDAWVHRTRALGAREGIEQVFCFENRGREIGVTLNHPHGQIYGYPYVAPRMRELLDNTRAHLETTGRDLMSDLLAEELRVGDRVVVRSEHWTAFVPYAARWPMEVHLLPNRKVPDLPALDDAELDDLATTYLDVLRRMESVYDDTLPYLAGWFQAPASRDRELAYLHLRITSPRRAPGKLKYLAGSESIMGGWINDVQPEQMAELLRGAGA